MCRSPFVLVPSLSNMLPGIFAGPKKIPANSFIGIYAGEYLTDEQCEQRGMCVAICYSL